MKSRHDDVVDVSGLRSHIGFWLRSVSNAVSQDFARRLLAKDVTPAEWVILRELYDVPAHTPSVLADDIGMTRGALSRLTDRLVLKGLVSRTAHIGDRRYQAIALSTAGRKLVPKLAALADRSDAEYFSPLTASERKTLTALLLKLAETHSLKLPPTE